MKTNISVKNARSTYRGSGNNASPARHKLPVKHTGITRKHQWAAWVTGVGMGLIGFFIGAGFFWAVYVLTGPQLSLVSTSSLVAKGQEFVVHVYADSKREQVNAVQAVVAYPNEALTLVRVDTSQSAYPIRAYQASNDGTVTLSRGVIGSLEGKQLVADLVFVGQKSADARISFNMSSSVLLATLSNEDILNGNGFNSTQVNIK